MVERLQNGKLCERQPVAGDVGRGVLCDGAWARDMITQSRSAAVSSGSGAQGMRTYRCVRLFEWIEKQRVERCG
jgi:hypothetical protein